MRVDISSADVTGDSDLDDLKLVRICGCWGLNFDFGNNF